MSIVCCPLTGSDDGDRPSFHSKEIRTARKAHTCSECDEVIPARARYEYVTGCWDGDVSTFKTCFSCVEIRDHFACGSGWVYGQVWNDLEENFFPDMKAGGPCMEGLSPEAKGRLFERRLDWLEE